MIIYHITRIKKKKSSVLVIDSDPDEVQPRTQRAQSALVDLVLYTLLGHAGESRADIACVL